MRRLFLAFYFCFCFSLVNIFFPVSASAETIVRGDGNDTIAIGLGDYDIYGNGGIDTLAVALFPNVYQVSLSGENQYTVRYLDYTLMLDSIEYIRFGTYFQITLPVADLSAGKVQEQLAKLTDLYLAFFGRAPDVEGLEYWQSQRLELGRDFATISKDFSWSTEAQALFPSEGSNRDFVQTVYRNCFGRDPDPGGWDYWTDKLNELDPQDPEYLNDRGAFVGELLLGAYAPTSGVEDRSLLINRHEVALKYVNGLAMQPEESFDPAINDLLAMVGIDPATRYNAENVIDHVFKDAATLNEIMNNTELLSSLWVHDASYDMDNDGDGWTEIQGDCNDNNFSVYPGAIEVCGDGIDQDCDGNDLPCTVFGISGTWIINEYSGNNTCGEPVGIYVDSYPVDIKISGEVILDDYTFFGSIVGNKIIWTGSYSFQEDGGTNTITSFYLTTSSDGYNAEGSASWYWTDGFESCSGTTNLFAQRTN